MATAILHNSTSPWEACSSQLYGLGKVAYSLATEKEDFSPVTVLRPSSKSYFSVKEYLADRKTKESYLAEEEETIQIKCAVIFFATPLFTLAKIVYAIFNTFIRAIQSAAKAIAYLCQGELEESRKKLKECSFILGKGLWEIIKAPLFCLSYQATALYGLSNPLRARKYMAQIEKIWNYDISFLPGAKEREKIDQIWDIESVEHPRSSMVKAFAAMIAQKDPFYLAPCMQSRGVIGKEMREIRSPFVARCISYCLSCFFPSES